MASDEPLVYPRKRREKGTVHGNLVESVNSLDTASFRTKYVPLDLLSSLASQDYGNLPRFKVVCETASGMLGAHIEACFRLVEATSASDYRNSEIKWSAAKKKKEMVLPDMKYIMLCYHDASSGQPRAAGFLSFMITYEDGHEVVYCYEVHVAEPWQRKGIGKKLMSIMGTVAKNVGVEKAMLTVFKSNIRALKMYESLGYGEDEFSPQPRQLRNGTIKEHSYVILSKDFRKQTAGHA